MIKVYISLSDGYRDVIALLLTHMEEIKIVGTSGDPNRLEDDIHNLNPDVILIGLSRPFDFILEKIELVKISFPSKKVLIFSNEQERDVIIQSIEAGADGYVLMSTPLMKLIGYIKEVHDGGIPLSAPIARSMFSALSAVNGMHMLPPGDFTTREMHTLRLLVKGLTYKEISSQLEISLDTVRSHIKNIYSKLEVNSKSEAIIKVLTGR